jgi:hypothetical protein
MNRSRIVTTSVLVAIVCSVTSLPSRGDGSISGCPVFPADNAWNRDISTEPVDPLSDAYIASLLQDEQFVHPDFGSNANFGIPFTVVPADQKPLKVKFTEFPEESDPGPYPIPRRAPVEGGGDRHTLSVQTGTCKLYELYHAKFKRKKWFAGGGAVFDLKSNAQRPAGWTSADAAGLPIFPGLARRDEAAAGVIAHALRFTAERTQDGYVDPARHEASSDSDPNLPPMGLRLRLKSTFDISQFTGASKVILQALKTYGMLLADNGTAGYISGATDTGWDDDDLNQLKTVPLDAFEAVAHGPIQR